MCVGQISGSPTDRSGYGKYQRLQLVWFSCLCSLSQLRLFKA
uniref:Uncharacterized protein n=1 Tax=Arundo donax TaxID=35708 RepID=A0A0A8ZJT2_ARUDO